MDPSMAAADGLSFRVISGFLQSLEKEAMKKDLRKNMEGTLRG